MFSNSPLGKMQPHRTTRQRRKTATTTQTTETIVTGLNGLEGIMIERPLSRRNLLRAAVKGLDLAAAAGIALPAAKTLAASTSGADALAELSQSPQTGGLELLRAWSAGQLAPNWLPGDG
jgi:hypothetical protein